MRSIPADQIVDIQPNVIGAGGAGLDLNALVLTSSTRPPIGSAPEFATTDAVAAYFGASSEEAAFAAIYFNGFTNSNVKPGNLIFVQYPRAAVSAFLRSGPVTMTLDQLKSITGIFTVTLGGIGVDASISLADATSFSSAAATIQSAFGGAATCVFDSVTESFVIRSATTGEASTISFATGALSDDLKLTQATGAVISQGASTATPGPFMSGVREIVSNWATFTTIFNPDTGSDNVMKLAFAAWTSQQKDRYCYVCWDADVTAMMQPESTVCLGYKLADAQHSGTFLVYGLDFTKAAFACGAIASIDFRQFNGRTTLAFRAQDGVAPDITNELHAANLISNGYNFYGAYGTANDRFVWMYPGSISGKFKWADSYVNQIWLNAALQQALMSLLSQAKSVPYNAEGYAMIRAACMDPILAAIDFGAIRPGVPLSAQQTSQVNTAAGVQIDKTLNSQGWYLQIRPAAAQVRGQRKTPPINLWYMDGGSIQQIKMASIEIV